MAKTATLTLQQSGNSLAVRIPSAVAKSAGFKVSPLKYRLRTQQCW